MSTETYASFLKDYQCCSLPFASMHELLQHYEETHAQQPASSTNGSSPVADGSASDENAETKQRLTHDETDCSPVLKVERFHCTEYPPCQLNFARIEHLQRHVRKHTAEPEFKCHCGRRFMRLDILRSHGLRHHSKESTPTLPSFHSTWPGFSTDTRMPDRGRHCVRDPHLKRRNSSASSVRSMVDERMRIAHEDRMSSREASPAAPPSPFRTGSPFSTDYQAKTGGSFGELLYNAAAKCPDGSSSAQLSPQSGKRDSLPYNRSIPVPSATYLYQDELHRPHVATQAHTLLSRREEDFVNDVPTRREQFSMVSEANLQRYSQTNPASGKPWERTFSCPHDLSDHGDITHDSNDAKVRCAMCREEKVFSRHDALIRHMRVVHPEVELMGKPDSKAVQIVYPHPAVSDSSSGTASNATTVTKNIDGSTPALDTKVRTLLDEGSPSTTTTRTATPAAQAAEPFHREILRPSIPLDLQDRRSKPSYWCLICGKSFGRRTLRDNHLRTHSDDRMFICSFDSCGQAFKLKNEQTRHEKTKHAEKSFLCGGTLANGRAWGCGKRFARSDGLLEHHTKTQKGRACLQARDAG
jgi:uncharacterized Zn-finger protein